MYLLSDYENANLLYLWDMRYYIYTVYFDICTALFQQFLVVFNKNTSSKFVKYIRQPLWRSAVTLGVYG